MEGFYGVYIIFITPLWYIWVTHNCESEIFHKICFFQFISLFKLRSHMRGAEAGGIFKFRLHYRRYVHTYAEQTWSGSAISWGQWWFGARGFEADVANWVLDPFLAERFLLPLRHRSATSHVWTHVMIYVEANFPPASTRACVNVPLWWCTQP